MKQKLLSILALLLMTVTGAWAQTETLLTTITATGKEQASYSTANVATVSFSYTAGGSFSIHRYLGLVGIRLVGNRQCCRRIHHHQMYIL